MSTPSTPDVFHFTALDESDTDSLGTALGKSLGKGGVVALVGTLGAGKTRLVRAVAAALGADCRLVTSPTFILIQEYEAALPIFHCDTYRLRDVDDFLNLGVDEMFQSGGVVLIEWADRVAQVLPADHLRIEIEIAGPSAREFHLQSTGANSRAVLESARSFLRPA
jgi:tRNA threonylcarbamoyladenosine biosynthesis protein TsaE